MQKFLNAFCALALLLATCTALGAQTPVAGAWTLGLSGGASLPMGEHQEYTSRALGNAAPGGTAGLELYYSLHKNIALGLSAQYYLHPVDAEKMAEAIWEENRTAATVNVTATPYQMGNIMLGIRPQTRLGDKLALYAGVSGGLLVVKSSTLTEELALSSPLHQHIDGATASTFCVQGELGLHWQLGAKVGLGLFASYANAKPTFDFLRSDVSETPTESTERHIQMANLGLKLSYALNGGDSASAKR